MTADKNQRRKVGLRIVSVIMSVLLWFYVTNQGSVASSGNMIEVDLQYRNVPADLNVSGPQQVSVKLWGSYHGTADITAYVDLSGLDQGVYELPVKLDTIKGAMFTSVQPDKVEVTLEELGEKVISIKYEVKQNPPAGYQLSQALLLTERCLVKGDADALANVAGVVAPIDLGNVKDIATVKSTLQARDINGKTITEGIQIVPATINVDVVLEKKQISKEVNITPQYTGTLADGFTIEEVTIDPLQVTILGYQTRVESIYQITTEPIDISGKSEDFTQVVDLVQPDGIVLVPTSVTVKVKITNTDTSGVQ